VVVMMMNQVPPSYRWEERIVVGGLDNNNNDDPSRPPRILRMSAETFMEWSLDDPVHPFSRLQQAWIGKEEDENEEDSADNSYQRGVFSLLSSGVIEQVTVSLASEASLGHPSGFWLHLRLSPNDESSGLSMEELNGLITQWQHSRLIATPLRGSVWDQPTVVRRRQLPQLQQPFQYQIFLPLNGAAWSADALKQSLGLFMAPCGRGPSSSPSNPPSPLFMGLSPMEWSKWLVEGSTTNKHMWMIWKTRKVPATTTTTTSTTGTTTTPPMTSPVQSLKGDNEDEEEEDPPTTMIEVRVGVSFDSLVELPDSLIRRSSSMNETASSSSSSSSCPLVTQRTVVVNNEPSTKDKVGLPMTPRPIPATTTLKQVVRRPTPNEGRLETWFETTSMTSSSPQPQQQQSGAWSSLCSFHLRQRLPYYFEPEWRSLQVLSSFHNETVDTDDDDQHHHSENFHISVEWNNKDDNNDLSSVLTITHPQTPRSVLVSLDYQAAFLSIDDFPGDPNRGRELPPAVVTLVCRPPPNPSQQSSPLANGVSNTTEGEVVGHSYSFFSNSVLIVPPVPDMSMPFNVLSLSCSMYAYLIGTIMTLLIKRSSTRVRYRLHPDQRPPSMIHTLKTKRLLPLLERAKALVAQRPPPKVDSTATAATPKTIEDEGPNQEVVAAAVPLRAEGNDDE
jgi:Gpi16 subunit, GPI transamidase component